MSGHSDFGIFSNVGASSILTGVSADTASVACPGIIVRQRHTEQKQMGLQNEQCVESKKGRLRCCCNQVWTMNGGLIP